MTGKNITKKQSDSLYTLLKFIHDILVKHNIPYFIVGGTLLGAVRHQGIIPWDDDGDIAIFQKDANRFKKLIPLFEKAGYDIDDSQEDSEDDKACRKNNSCSFIIAGKGTNDLGCDVFIMKEKGGKITFADPYWETAENGGMKCYFLKSHVFPLIPVKFGNFFLFSPNNPIKHLNTCYGEDWNSKSQMLFNHRTGKWSKGTKHNMKENEYKSPDPPQKTKDSFCMRGIPSRRSPKRKSPKRRKSKRKSPSRRKSR
jgi:phosphorylcholine metabolism protein LicD